MPWSLTPLTRNMVTGVLERRRALRNRSCSEPGLSAIIDSFGSWRDLGPADAPFPSVGLPPESRAAVVNLWSRPPSDKVEGLPPVANQAGSILSHVGNAE